MNQMDICGQPPLASLRHHKPAGEVPCERCGLLGLCRVAGLGALDGSLLDLLVRRREPVAKGERLYNARDPARAIFAVKAGAFKAVRQRTDGLPQLVGFYLPGELMGLEAFDQPGYDHDLIALEPGSVCRLNLGETARLGERLLPFHQQLVRAMSRRIRHDQWMSLMMGMPSAEQRVAAFLVSLATRLGGHRIAAEQFRIPMSRQEIADYLGLAVETISRMFRLFQRRGLLEAHGRRTHIYDLAGLRAAAALSSFDGVTPGCCETLLE